MTEDATNDLLVRLDERTERIEADVTQLKHVVCEGNGSPPLTIQVARQDERIKGLETESRLSRREKLVLYVGGGGGGAVAVAHAILKFLGHA